MAVSSEEQEFKNHHVSVGLGHCVLLDSCDLFHDVHRLGKVS